MDILFSYLQLFDRTSNNVISKVVSMPIIFPSSEYMNLNFYITLLDSFCSLVLDHSWLTYYNLLMNWVSGSISFWLSCLYKNLASVQPDKTPVYSMSTLVESPLQFTTSENSSSQSHIAIISTPAFIHVLWLPGSINFYLSFCSIIQSRSTSLSEEVNLSNVSKKYHEFADVFSKSKAKVLVSCKRWSPK